MPSQKDDNLKHPWPSLTTISLIFYTSFVSFSTNFYCNFCKVLKARAVFLLLHSCHVSWTHRSLNGCKNCKKKKTNIYYPPTTVDASSPSHSFHCHHYGKYVTLGNRNSSLAESSKEKTEVGHVLQKRRGLRRETLLPGWKEQEERKDYLSWASKSTNWIF